MSKELKFSLVKKLLTVTVNSVFVKHGVQGSFLLERSVY